MLIGKTYMDQITTQKYISCKLRGRKKWVYKRKEGGKMTESFPEEVTLKLRLQIQDEWVGREGSGGQERTPSRQGTDDAKPCRSC